MTAIVITGNTTCIQTVFSSWEAAVFSANMSVGGHTSIGTDHMDKFADRAPIRKDRLSANPVNHLLAEMPAVTLEGNPGENFSSDLKF